MARVFSLLTPLLFWVQITFYSTVLFKAQVNGQYIQSWEWRTVNGQERPFWRPTITDASREIINLSPDVLYLEYNCFYMKAICQNARQYLISAINTKRRWRTAFTYDFNSGRGNAGRRPRMCGGWDPTQCPERAVPGNLPQPPVMRNHDVTGLATSPPGIWPETQLELNSREIRGFTDANGNYRRSGLTYTCDEFPPAKWVEGGIGVSRSGPEPVPEGYGEPGYTRCAPQRYNCGRPPPPMNSEQDWQGLVHARLRRLLLELIDERPNFSGFQPSRDAVIFFFRMSNQNDGVAARVIREDATGAQFILENQLPTRELDNKPLSAHEYLDWADQHVLNYSSPTAEVHELMIGNFTQLLKRGTILGPFADFGLNISTGRERQEGESLPAKHQKSSHRFDQRSLGNETDHEDEYEDGGDSQSWRIRKRTLKPSFTSPEFVSKPVSKRDSANSTSAPLLKAASTRDVQLAREIVRKAIAKASTLNKARVESPARNKYTLKPGTVVGSKGNKTKRQDDTDVLPLLEITPEIANAAALLAEFDAASNLTFASNSTFARRRSTPLRKRGNFWMEALQRKGTVPWGNDPTYKVFRNVHDYGARGDGRTDDTEAIRKAMFDGNRCGEKCNGATTKNAIVYFPPGDYLVSTTIEVIFGTQLIGDANDWPTIRASPGFVGLGVLSTDEYVDGGGVGEDGKSKEWYINTANFYRQIRNFKIDITATDPGAYVCGLHYQIAQATSLQYVEIVANSATTQQGMFSENGSGGVLADITFRGGNFGFYGGNQQFTAQRLKFIGCKTAVQTIWDWGWVWKSISVTDSTTGFRLLREEGSPDGYIGSASFIDSTFTNVGTAILVAPVSSTPGTGTTGLVVENVDFVNVGRGVADTGGNTLLSGGSKKVLEWVAGPVYTPTRSFSMGTDITPYPREQSLLGTDGRYFEKPKPQYEGNGIDDFVHLKDLGAKGDGISDDTSALQNALNNNIGKIIFVDAGTYILTGTVTIPSGTKLVGETWSQFAAKGSYFSDPGNPKVMIRVGVVGQVGNVEMQDLIFTTKGPTAGAILIEWNIKASDQGSAGLWDCHVRIGGATGTDLNPQECPPITNGINPNCQAASLMMHITSGASGYFENMWLWVADHLIDDPLLQDDSNPMTQTSVYVARGLLIESRDATWLYGTSSEHCVYYQYNFHKARNIFAGMIQTESPYYQPVPKAPKPFELQVGLLPGDPDYSCKGGAFDGCDSSWGVMITKSQNIFIAGAGVYSWFDTYTQSCIDAHTCQKALIFLQDNFNNVRLQHVITIGATYSLVSDGQGVLATTNLGIQEHPAWSQITIFDVEGTGGGSVQHISPDLATIIPMAHTTVPAGATFTLGPSAATDIVALPYDGNQNNEPGPGASVCPACSFFRLITSTCCGVDGSLGNPIMIPAGQPTPMDVELPIGFIPSQPFVTIDGENIPANSPLTNETTIPAGTVFPSPFIIPAGQPLRDGEDVDESIVWISPDIWNSSNPQITCTPGCTLMLPPWPSDTGTIDFPRITWTDSSTTTTITYPPITVTQWDISTEVVQSINPEGSTTSTGIIAIITPKLSSTPTWPVVTWEDSTGNRHSTQPSRDTHPPPPFTINPPHITIIPGPPGPLTFPCLFPAIFCPPGPGPLPPGGGGIGPILGDPEDPEEEDPEDPDFCLLDPDGSDGSPTDPPDQDPSTDAPPPPSTTTTTRSPEPPEPTYASPDPSKNTKNCYNFGQWVTRPNLIPLIEQFCTDSVNITRIMPENTFIERTMRAKWDVLQAWIWVDVVMSIEVFKGCEWKPTFDECGRYFRILVDSCNCEGVNYKKGGTAKNNCLGFRLDPNQGNLSPGDITIENPQTPDR